jgi:hypothetical protein
MIRNLALWNVIKTLWLFKKKSLLASNQAIQATAEETRGDEEESSAAAPDRQRYRFSLLNLNYHKDCSSMIILCCELPLSLDKRAFASLGHVN